MENMSYQLLLFLVIKYRVKECGTCSPTLLFLCEVIGRRGVRCESVRYLMR